MDWRWCRTRVRTSAHCLDPSGRSPKRAMWWSTQPSMPASMRQIDGKSGRKGKRDKKFSPEISRQVKPQKSEHFALDCEKYEKRDEKYQLQSPEQQPQRSRHGNKWMILVLVYNTKIMNEFTAPNARDTVVQPQVTNIFEFKPINHWTICELFDFVFGVFYFTVISHLLIILIKFLFQSV